MRKILLLIAVCLSVVVLSISVCTFNTIGTDYAPVLFEEASSIECGGYPRLAELSCHELQFFGATGKVISLDSGESFSAVNKYSSGLMDTDFPKTFFSDTSTEHTLTRANHQALELSDGSMILAYRCHTASYVSGEFYTSIRVAYSDSKNGNFKNEEVIIEKTLNVQRGYWEPFLIQLDDDTVAMYYSDDSESSSYQYIMLTLYDIPSGVWSEPVIAVNGKNHSSRDGMPIVDRLKDGGYVMSIEAQPYKSDYTFATQLWFSTDGITWGGGVLVVAPESKWKPGVCAAPAVCVLGDGRLAVSYQCNSVSRYRSSEVYSSTTAYNAVPCLIVSKSKITYDGSSSNITPITKFGISSSFEYVTLTFEDLDDVSQHLDSYYGIWNSVSYCDGYLFYLTGMGYNVSPTERKGFGTKVCRALVCSDETVDKAVIAEKSSNYEIDRPEKLLHLMADSSLWSGSYLLTADIDLSDYSGSLLVQKPIGISSTSPFRGKFNGGGHLIKGIEITGSKDNTGLFGYCSSAVISDLSLYGSVTSTKSYVGSLCGYSNSSTFSNVCAHVDVTGKSYVGGLIGRSGGASGKILNCESWGSVSATGSNSGGLVGYLYGSKANCCVAHLPLNSSYEIIGYKNSTASVEGCYGISVPDEKTAYSALSFSVDAWLYTYENGPVFRKYYDGAYCTGDVNGNSCVDSDDLAAFARHIAAVSSFVSQSSFESGDLNCDGNIDSDDLAMLARYISGVSENLY